MIKNRPFLYLTFLVSQILTSSIFAQLDDIGEKPWLGKFAVQQDRKTQLVISSTGGMEFFPVNNGEAHPYNKIPVLYGVMLENENGEKYLLKPIPESLTSDDKATTKFKKTTIKGRVEGDAEFEMSIEMNGVTLSIGGRLLSPGKYQTEKVQFGIATRVLDFYTFQKRNAYKDDPEGFLDLISEDTIELKRTDRKKQTHEFAEKKILGTDAVNGPGIKEAEVALKILRRTFIFEASKNSSFTISNNPEAFVYQGMLIKWTPICGKDPKEESRLSISMK